MRHVPQTRFGADGNCFEACIASLIDCDLEEVPRYTESNEDMCGYLARLDQWLAPRGLSIVVLNRKESPPGDRLPDFVAADAYYIASIQDAAADFVHAVVLRGSGELQWNPDGSEPLRSDWQAHIDSVAFLTPRPV